MMNPTIELNGLEVQLGGRTILHGLTGILKSRAIGLLGPNGAGKSTLINTVLGFHSPSKGSARVLGLDSHTNGKALRSLVGYMPENDAFISKMSGVRFVRYMAEVSGLPSAQAMERAHEAFVYVGLGEARYRPVGAYSLGMKQLVKLAQAIVHEERRANRKFLELETMGAEATFTSTLEGLGCECAVFTNGRIKIVMPDGVEIREVFKVAADKGVQIRRMNHRRDSLEDIFLNAMEQTGAADGRI